jgi:hypothetical protein
MICKYCGKETEGRVNGAPCCGECYKKGKAEVKPDGMASNKRRNAIDKVIGND